MRIFGTGLAAFLAGLLLLASVPAARAATVIGAATPANGFVGPLFPTFPTLYFAASDGLDLFDPFGAGFDISKGIQLPSVFGWTQAPGGIWTSLGTDPSTGEATWVLPSDLTAIGCGAGNEPDCKWEGHFI
jgi:hypothetical protein